MNIKWNPYRLKDCLIQATETFTDLLSNQEDSSEELFSLEHDFVDHISSENYIYEEISFENLNDLKTIHTQTLEELGLDSFYGALVILKTKKGRILLDGNHRFNSLKGKNYTGKVWIVEIELSTDLI